MFTATTGSKGCCFIFDQKKHEVGVTVQWLDIL